ncbi:hypothetical protein Hanom_Chr11g00997911 [Helianthus anomalus]
MCMVNHPKSAEIETAEMVRLDFEWKTVNNTVDCEVFVMRHMETWFGSTADKWDSGFPLGYTAKKACLTRLRKKYTIKLVTSKVNKHRSRVLAEASEHEKAMSLICHMYLNNKHAVNGVLEEFDGLVFMCVKLLDITDCTYYGFCPVKSN